MLVTAYVFPADLIGVPVEPFLLTNNNSHPHTKALKDTHTRITQTQTYKHAPTHTQVHTHTHTRTYRQGPPANTDTPRKKSIDPWVEWYAGKVCKVIIIHDKNGV
jgi:hypothetical protein